MLSSRARNARLSARVTLPVQRVSGQKLSVVRAEGVPTSQPPEKPAQPSAASLEDNALVAKAQKGDARAFELLVQRYQRRVVQLALSMLKDPDEAMDIAQETFVRVHRFLPSFKGDSSFYTWTFRIASNLCLDAARRRGRRPMVDLEDAGDELEAALDPPSHVLAGPQKSTLNNELKDQLDNALQQLPEKHKSILLLREIDGLSYEELSQVLGIRKGTVMSRLFHARLKMQRMLREYLGSDAPRADEGEEEDAT
ncbi:MAG: sigma-70 family RNA polymerase sigma factor [Deltaproteobacteria bacterium]|nr:sigma-70 family RNA polymerase sigma factor [Deltaproteobacteria bacterium]